MVTIGYLKVTVIHIRVTLGHLGNIRSQFHVYLPLVKARVSYMWKRLQGLLISDCESSPKARSELFFNFIIADFQFCSHNIFYDFSSSIIFKSWDIFGVVSKFDWKQTFIFNIYFNITI